MVSWNALRGDFMNGQYEKSPLLSRDYEPVLSVLPLRFCGADTLAFSTVNMTHESCPRKEQRDGEREKWQETARGIVLA